ncbi:MAG TPA: methyltransferase [Candidatus Dormibacteraeota bacterium]
MSTPVAELRTQALRLVMAFRVSQCVRVAASLRLPELLAAGPRSDAELAAATGTNRPSLRRLLRTLVALGLLTEDGSDRFAVTRLGQELSAERAGPAAEFFPAEVHWAAWQRLDHSIRTGERAFDLVHGMRNWELYARSPEWGARFDAAMRATTGHVAAALPRAHDFSRYTTVVDVGGGDGTVLIEVLRANPKVRGVLFDRPDVVARAETRFAASDVAGRVQTASGSFLEGVPGGGDAYILKSILHDWEDESARAILSRVREAARGGADLLLVERVLPERPGPEDLDSLLGDLNMMVNNGGQERTVREFEQLMETTGFRLAEVLPTGTASEVLRGVAV